MSFRKILGHTGILGRTSLHPMRQHKSIPACPILEWTPFPIRPQNPSQSTSDFYTHNVQVDVPSNASGPSDVRLLLKPRFRELGNKCRGGRPDESIELPGYTLGFLRAFRRLGFLDLSRRASSRRVRYGEDAPDVGGTGGHGEGSGLKSRCTDAQTGCGCRLSRTDRGVARVGCLYFTIMLSTMFSTALRPAAFSALRQYSHLSAAPSSRSFHAASVRRYPPNDGGLTNILAGGEAPAVQVKTITANGIQLADGLVLPAACIFLNGKVFLWNVPEKTWDGWTPEHFEVFDTVVPKPGKCCSGVRAEEPPFNSNG